MHWPHFQVHWMPFQCINDYFCFQSLRCVVVIRIVIHERYLPFLSQKQIELVEKREDGEDFWTHKRYVRWLCCKIGATAIRRQRSGSISPSVYLLRGSGWVCSIHCLGWVVARKTAVRESCYPWPRPFLLACIFKSKDEKEMNLFCFVFKRALNSN